MLGRELIHEHGADEQIRQIGIGFERYDDLMMSIEWALLRYPEMFPTVPSTRLSICKTNEFVGGEFSEIPSLVIFFYYDENSVRIVAVESNVSGSYGL